MGQTMSEQWTPNTEGVRMVFSFYPEMDGALKTSQRQAIAEFDRWLAKHDLEIVARTLAADATNGYRKVFDTELKWQGWIDDARCVIRKGPDDE
jgi:hypothetical protein